MNEISNIKKQFKDNISKLIKHKQFEQAKDLINQYENIVHDDIEIYSMKAVIFIMENDLNKAEEILLQGLSIDENNFDINYNLAYIYESSGKFNKALDYYGKSLICCHDESMKEQIRGTIANIENNHKIKSKRKRIVFFSKGDDKFILDIINELSEEYETKKIVVTNYRQIDEGMEWADICWFEWCDELVIYGSKLPIAREKKIICRLHSYEAFTNYIYNVQWDNVDKVIFVAEHIRNIVLNKVNIPKNKAQIIYNGVNLNKFKFKERKRGFNIAYVGYINFKKGPMLLLHVFKAIYDMDKRYKLYIAGEFQEERYVYYFRQMIEAMGLQNNIIFEGWQNDINNWLEDKNYIISTSVLEGNPLGIMEGMARGIKPLIHNFVGAKQQFGKYVWNSIDECKKMLNGSYNSYEYRKFIENNFSLEKQINKIFIMLNDLTGDNKIYNNKFNENEKEHYIIQDEQKETQVKDYYDNFLTYLINDRKRENPRHVYLKNRIGQIVKKGQSVLDLGCGIGITTEHIKKAGADRVIGVDISPKLIEYAKATVKDVEFIVHDITNIILNEKFDAIFMCDCMEHIPIEKYDELFNTLKKHLKEDGMVYISIPDGDYAQFVQQNRPDLMQIIDNSIDFELMNQLCRQNGMKIIFYNSYGTHIGNEYNEYIITNFKSFSKPWKTLLK